PPPRRTRAAAFCSGTCTCAFNAATSRTRGAISRTARTLECGARRLRMDAKWSSPRADATCSSASRNRVYESHAAW
ncbi:hypothetical protein ACM9HC_33750, partial [Streptomyces sp. JAC18]|uniref:hypothetical protein n=1 Tax=Streptomyces sp. JAC18 TaxID=3418414 RepID=UPI003D81552B